ncbi:MAG: hypothetical protein ACHQSE_09030 [Gemmatimonadales bacterium]
MRAVLFVLLVLLTSATVRAQKPDSVRATKPDSAGFSATVADTVAPRQATKRVLKSYALPPISARRAFLYSALVPGLGQTALDRKYTGATFFLIEAMSWALLRRSTADVRTAQAFLGDSVPKTYAIDPTTGLAQRDAHGNPVVATWSPTTYTAGLLRARKLHVEDWVAVILFNHLFSGADAYVAANLWDLPQHVGMRASPLPGGGAAMTFTFSFR